MIGLVATSIIAAQPAGAKSALARCRPALAHKAAGEIATINADKSKTRGSSTTISGRMTVFIGMGPPAAGSASAHHLIRADYRYTCAVRGGRVLELKLSQ